MIVTYPNYLDQTQAIGFPAIIEYHSSAIVTPPISGVYGVLFDRPDTHPVTHDEVDTHTVIYDE